MRKARDIIGLPVIDLKTGRRIGTVKDIMFDSNWQIRCILLETKTWLITPRAVELDDTVSLGEDAVTVQETPTQTDCPVLKDAFFLFQDKKIIGLPVLTKNGQELGLIEDVYFDEKLDKRIVGFEMSEGFLSDVTAGRKWLPFPEEALLGEDAVIVPVQSHQEVKPLTNQEIG
ncbi:MAG: PRC-barrel domain-containing protein [Gorillibacterium sp.]|nr:PRC-barrel domain-containing protein [Gorillibacterium sp.]